MTATIPAMGRPRGELSEDEAYTAGMLKRKADEAQAEWRDYCVFLLVHRGRSFAEISKETGLSTNTLQRWKREATREDAPPVS